MGWYCSLCDQLLDDCECDFCPRCGELDDECACEELFDADELGLDPEDDDERRYGPPGFGSLLYRELEELHRRLPLPGEP